MQRRRQDEEKKRRDLEQWLLIERKRTMRELRYRQLKAIELMPAGNQARKTSQPQIITPLIYRNISFTEMDVSLLC